MRYRAAIRTYAVALCLMCSAILIGQSPSPSGHVSGHVVDASGASIPNASVFVRSYSQGSEEIKLVDHADRYGNFVLTLPPGAYDIIVIRPGFKSELRIVKTKPGKMESVQWKLMVQDCDFPGVNCDTFK